MRTTKQMSKKAYEEFNKRVINAFRCIDPYFLDGIGVVMGMIDLFLGGKDVMFEVRSKEVKLVYALLLPEVEKAVARSERARENAARRREKKLAEQKANNSKINNSEQTETVKDDIAPKVEKPNQPSCIKRMSHVNKTSNVNQIPSVNSPYPHTNSVATTDRTFVKLE
ncbi:MAG: hypothetical protein J6A20_10785 [Muribaculaceae bacterium]|nr:hypothetical protein [Muribaculaceae bacterium]